MANWLAKQSFELDLSLPHCGGRDPYQRPLSPRLQAIVTAQQSPACTWSTYHLDVGTLRVVTARELVILSGSFIVPLNISETAPPFRWVMWATRGTQSPMLRARNKCPQAYFTCKEIEPRATAWQAHMLPLCCCSLPYGVQHRWPNPYPCLLKVLHPCQKTVT